MCCRACHSGGVLVFSQCVSKSLMALVTYRDVCVCACVCACVRVGTCRYSCAERSHSLLLCKRRDDVGLFFFFIATGGRSECCDGRYTFLLSVCQWVVYIGKCVWHGEVLSCVMPSCCMECVCMFICVCCCVWLSGQQSCLCLFCGWTLKDWNTHRHPQVLVLPLWQLHLELHSILLFLKM